MRALARATALALWLAFCLLPHLVTRAILGRSRWPRRFLAGSARICGARVTLRGEQPGPHSLLICNHLSWLDIPVLGGATGCAFVSKDMLANRLFHWLADQNRTIYVRRDDRRGARSQAAEIARALERDKPVALFPEGTVGPGDELLPFRSTLLEAVNIAGPDIEVRPVVVDYGRAAAEISWHGETGEQNVRRVLGRRGRLPVTVHVLEPLDRTLDRKAMAEQARRTISEALASSRASAPLYARSR